MSRVLAINAGSSSVKFAVFTTDGAARELLRGHVDGTGADAQLVVDGVERDLAGGIALRPMPIILDVLEHSLRDHDITVVGHRIVHGGADFVEPAVLSADVMDKLTALEPLAPLHQPHDLAIVRDAMEVFPDAVQVGLLLTRLFMRANRWRRIATHCPARFMPKGCAATGFTGFRMISSQASYGGCFPTCLRGAW